MAAFAPSLGQNLRSRPPRNPNSPKNDSPRQLEFTAAMEDFQKMFPSMDNEVIEAVLRANNGLVDATIDQLLTMGAGNEKKSADDFPHLPSYVDTGPREPPPAYSPRESDISDGRPLPARPYSAWNPPLLGTLPDDFLRFTHIPSSRGSPIPVSCPSIDEDKKSEQFLEDEKLAQVLQNEEFVRELSRNKDFMMSLERDKQRNMAQKSPSDDLPHPITTSCKSGTRRKLDKMARIFHRKKNTQKANLMVAGSTASTTNLLEEYQDDDDDDLLNTMAAGRLEIIKDEENELEITDAKHSARPNPDPPSRLYDPFDPVEFYAEDNEFQFKNEK